MPDDLRTRIAKAIYNASDEYAQKLMVRPDCPGASEVTGDGKPVCYAVADAVIRELGLSRRSGWTENGHRQAHRYVTEWTADD